MILPGHHTPLKMNKLRYHLNKSRQAVVFGVRPHTKNNLTANY